MVDYRLYPRADAAQDRIWRYSVETWGEAQAIAYVEGLHAHLRMLTSAPQIWRKLPPNFKRIGPEAAAVYFSRYSQHYIFFKVLSNGDLGIMSILHGRTDMPARLRSDLAALDRS